MIKRFVGVDISLSNTGLAVIDIDKNGYTAYSIKTSPKTPLHVRFQEIISKAMAYIERGDCVCFEDFAALLRGVPDGKFTTRVEIMGGIRYAVYDLNGGGIILNAHPTTMKKFITGSGASEKEAVRTVLDIRGYTIRNYDEADALSAALIAAAVFHKDIYGNIQKPQIDALKKFMAMNKEVLNGYNVG